MTDLTIFHKNDNRTEVILCKQYASNSKRYFISEINQHCGYQNQQGKSEILWNLIIFLKPSCLSAIDLNYLQYYNYNKKDGLLNIRVIALC
jgi:hypothetical protein